MALVPTRAVADNPAVVLAENTIAGSEGDYRSIVVQVQNVTGTAPIYLGGQGVTNATGFEWDSALIGRVYERILEPGEKLYGYAATPQTVHVLAGGR